MKGKDRSRVGVPEGFRDERHASARREDDKPSTHDDRGHPTLESRSGGAEWIWGRRPVLEALQAGRVRSVLVAESVHDPRFMASLQLAATAVGAHVDTVDKRRIQELGRGHTTQGVMAEMEPFSFTRLQTILDAGTTESRPPLILILDQIQDPRNLGSLIRGAVAAGVDGVILSERRSATISGIVSKASAGAVYHVPIATAASLTALIGQLQTRNIWSIGLDQSAKPSIYQCDLTVSTAIVVGSEGEGLRRLTAERVDMTASIPMKGRIGSLNASVAGAIALFEANRQRSVQEHQSRIVT